MELEIYSETIKIINSILSNILVALYQSFWFSFVQAVFVMFFYLYAFDDNAHSRGIKVAFKSWAVNFKSSKKFRYLFCMSLYSSMIMFRTLFNRKIWLNPLINIWGNWWIYTVDVNTGEIILTTECLENLILFIPFTYLFCCLYIGKKRNWFTRSIKIIFLCSLAIELLQLFLRLGTFQISDLFYNTFGGLIGSVLFWIKYKLFRKKNRNGG